MTYDPFREPAYRRKMFFVWSTLVALIVGNGIWLIVGILSRR